MKKDVMVIQNNVCIGKHNLRNVSKIMGNIFSPFINQLEYMSLDAIQVMIINAIEMIEELSESSVVKKAGFYVRNKVILGDRKELLTFITNSYLIYEEMGLLRGFGCANYSANEGSKKVGAILLNPEFRSIMEIEK